MGNQRWPQFQNGIRERSIGNILNYASTANIEKAIKFYNIRVQTFETDFRYAQDLSAYTW